MAKLRRVGGLVWCGLRELERRWIRPLGQRFRPTRAHQARAKAGPPGTEELLVALLRSRLRNTPRCDERASDERLHIPIGAIEHPATDVGSLVHALMAVPPRRGHDDQELLRKAA